jgi:hypothetical protein
MVEPSVSSQWLENGQTAMKPSYIMEGEGILMLLTLLLTTTKPLVDHLVFLIGKHQTADYTPKLLAGTKFG